MAEGTGTGTAFVRTRAAAGLAVQVGMDRYPLLACDDAGFEIACDIAPRLPGHVQIHQGGRLVRSALIVMERSNGASAHYAFKRSTPARAAPPADFAPGTDVP
ncbi:hypothetical protein [Jannaschia sp. LMIT008]|uniref:hypothetical protein n=1 Tax=Jannaschia maritima TaxID=3032585 RepID=UPI0028127BA0|nr:hypothetical protein [Jannaschia sp. LMIT008]